MREMRKKLIDLLDEFPVNMEWHDNAELANFLISNGIEIPVRCDDCVHYDPPDDGDFLGRCTSGILAVSNSGEIYPGRGFYCLYGERKNDHG